jgi:PAS domain S-box-containing protein
MKLRLQAKYTLSTTALILAVSAVVALTLHLQFRQTTIEMASVGMAVLDDALFKEVVADGSELVALLSANAGAPLATGDTPALQRVLYSGLAARNVDYVFATDHKGHVFHAGATAAAPLLRAPAALEIRRAKETLVITAPALHGDAVAGSVQVGFSVRSMNPRHEQMSSALQTVLATSHRTQQIELVTVLLALLLAGLAFGSLMARQLSRPVRALAHSLRNVAQGDLSHPLPSTRGHDEIADLAAAFATMRDSLGKTTVSRDFLHRIIDSLNEGLVVTDAEGNIRLANRAVNSLFGYGADELNGRPFSTLMVQPHQLAELSGESRVAEFWFLHCSGRTLPVMVSRSEIGAEESPEQVYVISDITERKRLEDELWIYRSRLEQLVVERTKELTAAVQELESFSYSVSHDLHAPLRAINGFGSALHEDYYPQLDETGRDYLDRMRAATVRMGQLIDGLLTLTRVVRSEIRRDIVDLSSIASEIAAEIAGNDPRRQATFRIAPKLSARGDPAHMRLLLQNLFGNAWKFTMKRPSALIELGEAELSGERAFFVRDNGEGFDPVFASGLFQPFHRLHSDEFPGTGIGLATVLRIVQRHGGQVWAEAHAGAGATFYFTLPEPSLAQVDESRVSSRMPLSNSVISQRPSATA